MFCSLQNVGVSIYKRENNLTVISYVLNAVMELNYNLKCAMKMYGLIF